MWDIKPSFEIAKILSKGKDAAGITAISCGLIACIPFLYILMISIGTVWWFFVCNAIFHNAFGTPAITWLQALGINLIEDILKNIFKSSNSNTNNNNKE